MPANVRTALVTGGAGFIGSHLVDSLLRDGWKVKVLDNLSTGRRENLADSCSAVELVEADIRDQAKMAGIIRGCEVVYHLAAVVSVVETTRDPLGTASINESGSLEVLEAARDAGVRRLVFASSCAVYGDDPVLPKREGLAPQPLTPYAAQKLAVENHLGVYARLWGMETVALRFFNVFGPRQDPSSPYSGVISIFIDRAVRREAPTIFGDGEQTRDFVYVGDIVQALRRAAEARVRPGAVFNVGTGRSVTINELWQRVAALSATTVQPLRLPRRAGEVLNSLSSIDLARRELGYAPAVSLERGLEETIGWYRTQLTPA